MTDNNSKKKNGSKIFKLIIWLIVLGLLVFLGAKTFNITLNAHALDAANWQELNDRPLRVASQSTIDNNLLSADYYSYLSNGNSETGQNSGGFTAFSIYDMNTGEQYDAIYIRTVNIVLRRIIYDSITGDMVDYYERTIWANDYAGEGITPDTIIFENLNNSLMASSSVKYKLYDGTEQTGANNNIINSMFLDIINDIFAMAIDYSELGYYNYDLSELVEISFYLMTDSEYFYGFNIMVNYDDYNNNTFTADDKIFLDNRISFNDIINNDLNYYFDVYLFCDDATDLAVYILILDLVTGNTIYDEELYFNVTLPSGNTINNNVTYYNCIATAPNYTNYLATLNYNNGYGAGYRLGYDTGESVGLRDGYNDGYNDGYDDGASNTLNTNWILSIMNTATSILQIEIFPGIKIIYLVGAFIILAFVRFVINWIR